MKLKNVQPVTNLLDTLPNWRTILPQHVHDGSLSFRWLQAYADCQAGLTIQINEQHLPCQQLGQSPNYV